MKRIAAITGGLGDIGNAIGKALENKGWEIAACDIQAAAPEDFSGHYFQADVRSEDSVQGWFDAMEGQFGRPPSLVVVNAGVHCESGQGGCLGTSMVDWCRTIDVNLTGAWLTAREGARRFLKAGVKGDLLFVGSWVGRYPVANLAAYCASKAGMHSLMKSMALELAPHGIRVNEIAPGYVDAGLSGKIFDENKALALQAKLAVPVGQLVSREEVARAAVLLIDPENPSLTGSTLVLDGGLSLIHGPQNIG